MKWRKPVEVEKQKTDKKRCCKEKNIQDYPKIKKTITTQNN